MRKYFGTDGIRGRANVYPMTPEMAMLLGRAVTHYFRSHYNSSMAPRIIVGKDTRISCYMLELAFSAGVCSQGGKVVLTGPLPTPGVSFATTSMRANAGVMISASHNPYHDNGIKIFDAQGNKLPDEIELELEKMLENPDTIPRLEGSELGSAKRLDEVLGRYIVHVKSSFTSRKSLEGMRIVLDCANGACYKVAPMIFEEMGAEVFTLGVNPNGQNINASCGSTHPEQAQADVKKFKADLGICLDGDGDRLIVIDSRGDVVDGDKILGLFAKFYLDKKMITKGSEVVGTVMSNLGLENYLKSIGLAFFRSKVGDRYILERMGQGQSILGGEPSGHLILGNYSSTGDGLVAALKVIECLQHYNQPLRELVSDIKLYPQILQNVVVKSKPPIESNKIIQEALVQSEKELATKGRVLLRYSGTEPYLRVMVEGENSATIEKVCKNLVNVVMKELGT